MELSVPLLALLTFAMGGVVSFAASPAVRRFAHIIGAIDVPRDGRRIHKTPVPRLGGLAIFAGTLAAILVFYEVSRPVRGILLGSVIVVVLGVIDDVVRLKAWIKLIVQIVAALVPVFHGVVVEFLSNPIFFSDASYIDLGALSWPLTVLWIVAITNSVNLIDGLDGLAVGVSAISSLTLLVIALLLAQPEVAVIMAALAGACVGFMPYNINPAKMFMGDTGATFLGYVLACVSILGLFKFYTIISFAVPFLILGLPIFDTVMAVVRRLSSGQSPIAPDRSHVHHRLIDMGFSQKQSVAILYTLSAILGLAAVLLTTSGELKAMYFLLAVIVAVLVGARLFRMNRKGVPPAAPSEDDRAAGGGASSAASPPPPPNSKT
ncbi:MAG: undecaprenyl/decaprenyl-phosphate alpha-N-acetylglucosaminyl 1-phosphate transferase [Oscillospiraceae bacterium]|nr:undecaprenyl/decaprenyl-phosphate alpha-N-acetylglucosaminyl 1-phosphate transferase [Oscillospiraceae bacterium]